MEDSPALTAEGPSLSAATKIWGKIGLLSFGGPAAQIGLMHKTLVVDHKWLSERQFLNALNFCMLLPGPEAMQLATYAGWRLQGVVGGLIAGLLFVLPGALVIMSLAALYASFGQLPLIAGGFAGVQAAVLVIVFQALIKLSHRALKDPVHWIIAGLAFLGIFMLNAPFPLIVVMAALVGSLSTPTTPATKTTHGSKVTVWTTAQTIAIWLLIWLTPLGLLFWLEAPAILRDIAVFFAKLAAVSFGGAYAVLAYVAQEAVATQGWLSAQEMVDALGLAETTPGPLILVTQFVGFLAGAKQGGLLMGLGAAFIVLWVTFAPCFLWVFAGAPYIDRLANMPRLQGALGAVTAAVVGVILNLSIWFAVHVLFADVSTASRGPFTLLWPDVLTLNWAAALLLGLGAFLVLRLRWNIVALLGTCGLLGAASAIL